MLPGALMQNDDACLRCCSYVVQGERFNEFKKDNFYQIQWRPRPASLLTVADKKKVVKNLRKVRVVPIACGCFR